MLDVVTGDTKAQGRARERVMRSLEVRLAYYVLAHGQLPKAGQPAQFFGRLCSLPCYRAAFHDVGSGQR